MAIKNLHREITHTRYNREFLLDKGDKSWLKRSIDFKFDEIRVGDYPVITDEYIELSASAYIAPIIYTVISIFLFTSMMLIPTENEEIPTIYYIVLYLAVFMFLSSIIYMITMPKKERILNRMEGTITFPGYIWGKTITMKFDNIKFTHTNPGANFVGGYSLLAAHPSRIGTTAWVSMSTGTCYEDLSFITWYMDRNRPLPPGAAFDPYRQKDFERRKALGFPKPLYPANIKTPEATPEQQKERNQYWKG